MPAAVEADRSCKNIIFLTADRPLRLKDCGANQTVNQEDFLSSVCRRVLSTNLNGLHETQENEILNLVRITEKQISTFPGPIHLNIPITMFQATASSISSSNSSDSSIAPTNIFFMPGVPVPAGIRRPTATFSFNPCK